MELWLVWLLATGVLLIAELLTTTVWFLCIAIGTLGAMTCAIFGGGIVPQVVVLLACTIIALVFVLPPLRRALVSRNTHAAATNADAMIGRRATVTQTITPGHLGRVKLDGDSWQARARNPQVSYPEGATVTVHALDSIILIVD